MRIRKRSVPLPFSSVSPVPLSDPLFLNWEDLPPVQSTTNSSSSSSSIPAYVSDPPPKEEVSADHFPISKESRDDGMAIPSDGGGVPVVSIHYNHSRAPVDVGKSTSGSSPLVDSASLANEASATGQKKKRLSLGSEVDGNKNKMEKMMKASSSGNNSRRRGGSGGEAVGSTGTAITEGSGCSRVNGRGWRCGKQTRAGFSLCEHHLSSARLRSTKNARSRSTVSVTEASGKGDERREAVHHPTGSDPKPMLPLSLKEGSTISYDTETEDDNEGDDSAAKGKRKMRSVSSLLGQVPNNGDNAHPSDRLP
ncbi:hypothetical protein MLD38_021423 [Melastoma candidum]|uniref:Uncharacterized protein n=1 Tax=Melastoma candidum TaxID=119954 RepID=A0ACB9QH89_9MYRT|nr:hypothetical protein MLD38_021423 [Melastoma candidum]